MAERDFHAVNAVYRGVPGRSAAQGCHLSVGYETHMHQVILDALRQIEGD
jgi:hypothetical protein